MPPQRQLGPESRLGRPGISGRLGRPGISVGTLQTPLVPVRLSLQSCAFLREPLKVIWLTGQLAGHVLLKKNSFFALV